MLGAAVSFFNMVHIVLCGPSILLMPVFLMKKISLTACIATYAPAVVLLHQIGETVHQELP